MGVNNNRIVRWTIFGGIGLVVLVAVAAMAGLIPPFGKARADKDQAAQGAAVSAARDPLAVTAEKVKLQKVQRTVQTVGSFAGYEELTVTAEVQGRVTKVHFDIGDIVHPGDLLLEIDPTDYELTVLEARTAFEAELAKLVPENDKRRPLVEKLAGLVRDEDARRALANRFAKEGSSALLERVIQIVEDLPSVKRATEQEKNAAARVKRGEETRKQSRGAISDEEIEQRTTDYEIARATRLQAVMDAQTTLAMASFRLATLGEAEQKLKYTQVVVPYSPTAAKAATEKIIDRVQYAVSRRRVDEGEMVKDSMNATAAVFDVVLDKVLKYRGTVVEQHVGKVKVGQKVALRVDAYPEEAFWGVIKRINPTVDRGSRTFQIEAIVPNADRKLKPGGFSKGDIHTHEDPQAKTVPPHAMVSFAGSDKVFVVREGTSGKEAHAVLVTLGASGPGWTEVTPKEPKELPADALVITSGLNQLVEGTPIRIRPEKTPPDSKSRQPDKAP